MGTVAIFGWRAVRSNRTGVIDNTELFCPKIVLRHEGKSTKCTQPPWVCNVPTGFFENLTMEGCQRVLARVYTPTR